MRTLLRDAKTGAKIMEVDLPVIPRPMETFSFLPVKQSFAVVEVEYTHYTECLNDLDGPFKGQTDITLLVRRDHTYKGSEGL